jgi:hypothetical protein
VPRIASHDQSISQTQLTLSSRSSGKVFWSKELESIWFCIGYNVKRKFFEWAGSPMWVPGFRYGLFVIWRKAVDPLCPLCLKNGDILHCVWSPVRITNISIFLAGSNGTPATLMFGIYFLLS